MQVKREFGQFYFFNDLGLRDHASNYVSFSGFGISYWWAKVSSLCLQYYAVVATIFLHVYERGRDACCTIL